MSIFSLLTPSDIPAVLTLQQANLKPNLTEEQRKAQGFLTIQHSPALLEEMNADAPSIVAKVDHEIAGFCLAMTRKFEKSIPILIPMFELIDQLEYENKQLKDYQYIVVGQVCVGNGFRGQGIFDGLYAQYKDVYAGKYELAVTEIAALNTRSMAAHQRVGFKFLHQYTAPDGQVWNIVTWNWK